MDALLAAPPLHVDSAGHGPPLVLLHGWAMHAGLFAPIVPALARGYRVHAVDLPGHGASRAVREWRFEDAVTALDRTFAASEAALDVVGWSLGALLALAWARRAPARIRRLVLVGATPCFLAGPDWPHAMAPQTLARFADELRVAYRPTLTRFLSLQVQGSDAGGATLAMLRQALFARGAPPPAALDEALRALASVDLRGDVAAIAQPTLVVAGERDALVPAAASAWLAQHLPRAQLVVVPGAAHAPFLSHPAPFLDAVQSFLSA